jgi:hypothetical protein
MVARPSQVNCFVNLLNIQMIGKNRRTVADDCYRYLLDEKAKPALTQPIQKVVKTDDILSR